MKTKELSYEIGPIRPPSEAYSLLVRFTRNCPWNKCAFCNLYKGTRFQKRPVEEIKRDIDAIRDIRRYIMDLRPPESKNLQHSITSLVEDFKSRTGLEVALSIKGAPVREMSSEVRGNIYHVAQEALSNIVRHARATRVEIGIEFWEKRVRFIIRDNGVGFDYEPAQRLEDFKEDNFGLRNMADRARLLQGSLKINSVRGRGTEIVLEVPYKAVTDGYEQDNAG